MPASARRLMLVPLCLLFACSSGQGQLVAESPTPVESPSPSPSPEPGIEVPDVQGLVAAQAQATLEAAGLDVSIERIPSDAKKGTVIAQAPSEGVELDPGDPVTIEVAVPLPRVPAVVGLGRKAAASRLRAVGFEVKIVKKFSSEPRGTVLKQTPKGKLRVEPGRRITLVVAKTNCTPGYSPCLPHASDYDCDGGGGNGPAYTGRVTVTGSDPYDLDGDGNGVGCE